MWLGPLRKHWAPESCLRRPFGPGLDKGCQPRKHSHQTVVHRSWSALFHSGCGYRTCRRRRSDSGSPLCTAYCSLYTKYKLDQLFFPLVKNWSCVMWRCFILVPSCLAFECSVQNISRWHLKVGTCSDDTPGGIRFQVTCIRSTSASPYPALSNGEICCPRASIVSCMISPTKPLFFSKHRSELCVVF